ncbi:MAG: thiamine phosphate synthase, partial [Nocardioidaceae bacterium]
LRRAIPSHVPLVAIGGIDETNAASVIEAGADGVAVVSAICGAGEPQIAARRLRTVVDAALGRRSAR